MSRFAGSTVCWRRRWRAVAVVALCALAGAAYAQPQAATGADDTFDPPSRVARLSYMSGDLGFLPSGAKDWSDANLNRPLTTGDKLSSAQASFAELEFGGGTLHVDGDTDFGLLDLGDDLAQIALTRGSLSITVRSLDEGQSYEIDTPAVALVIDQPGSFRVDVDRRDGSTHISALKGAATVFGDNNAQRSINPGRSYHFTDSSLNVVTISEMGRADRFAQWAADRDRRYAQSESTRYVSEEVVGYQDLDDYGSWQDNSDYGAMWFPRNVDANWAPYRNGHWAHIAPWGWTWVDDSPWGFAPYHYGRWAHVRGGWGWIPGPRSVRPIYAPALVAFVGGGGWSVGISSRPVGWFPLGPGEIYDPWYNTSRNYYTQINIRNIHVRRGHNRNDRRRDIDHQYDRYRRGESRRGHYANRGVPGGFSAMPGRSFADGRRVQRDLIKVDPRKLADAPLNVRGVDDLRPVRGQHQRPRSAYTRNLPAGGFHREVVARRTPPTARPAVMRGPANDAAARREVRMLEDAPGRAKYKARSAELLERTGNNRNTDSPDRIHDRTPRSGRPDRINNATPTTDHQPRGAARSRPSPAVPRVTATPPPVRDTSEPRSARYAHPRNRNPDVEMTRPAASRPAARRTPSVSEPTPAALPAVAPTRSYQSPARDVAPRQVRAAGAQVGERTVQRSPRFEADRSLQRDRPVRRVVEPRVQRSAPAPREHVRQQTAARPAPAQRPASSPRPTPASQTAPRPATPVQKAAPQKRPPVRHKDKYGRNDPG